MIVRRWVRLRWLAACFAAALLTGICSGGDLIIRLMAPSYDETVVKLKGRLVDHTFNGEVDRRFYSPALEEKRDLYVYLPPGYTPARQYPLLLWLHGFAQDERNLFPVAETFDRAICQGQLPPMIIATPDGSIMGRPSFNRSGSFYINSKAGNFEQYLANDVWNFLNRHYSIHPDREAHLISGASMGGFGSVNHAFKYRHRFGTILSLMPPLNLRYADCRGRYGEDYDPDCVSFRERLRPHTPLARFGGVVVIRQRQLSGPLFGIGRPAVERTAEENPIEMIDRLRIQPNEFHFFIGFGTRDEFNLDAQCEHFIDVAHKRGIGMTVVRVHDGKHDMETARECLPAIIRFLQPILEPYRVPLTP
ncbi:alpha/beta hydrolase [Tuwongella immobilis]|uniref:Esterase n=1 Tax=Tuwongella immobilis TaxID=692036 RepID=A0A6C2YJS9_9BACT|nr:alpha/beta hydrolase-fold protein [Tuwongella immobilis]VIP01363.1 Enterochelin esterase-like enzyme OS=Singulisphaera acidiphila (strain ATCC BAA-1392 / DSM 18658 / VKM B-2454 / MOB10) GN=Sinac_0969 PE=4 SV=1: Esterase [Tuwongella immobilis]VTR98182.1 Enterochelin esterase-like enzyme OS=Singulisphaera acidiphila (strain ATCC BAA-1392 / DSM 18658 / VKM B-2454 / MOB10) GN=Sinac_0969 PE=4 SV=1: Esterase [Tuwongella immobilis]